MLLFVRLSRFWGVLETAVLGAGRFGFGIGFAALELVLDGAIAVGGWGLGFTGCRSWLQ